MSRTRAGLLDGAVSVIERGGLGKVTMSAVATRSGVSKATLYNHFRTKDDVLRALVLREVELIADDADAAAAQARANGSDLVAATAAGLARAGGTAAEHVAARRVAAEQPGALAPLMRADDGPAWRTARVRLSALLGRRPVGAARGRMGGEPGDGPAGPFGSVGHRHRAGARGGSVATGDARPCRRSRGGTVRCS